MRQQTTVDSSKLRAEIEGLRHLTTGQLKDRYREVFSEESRSNHKQFLVRRIAWRIQANALGGLSERARQRALEIADEAREHASKLHKAEAALETARAEAAAARAALEVERRERSDWQVTDCD